MLTRRHFIERIAAIGGASLAYEAMTGLGMLEAATQTPFALRGDGKGTRIAILGAGLSGLTVAYELGKLGYKCQVFEARQRPGGRAHTIRRGTVSEEDGPTQTCSFDEGQYFNCGAMRVPYHHTTTLQYARELQVPIETFALTAENAYFYQTKASALANRRVRLREVRADLEGYVAELLSKAVSEEKLNEAVTSADREQLLEYLRGAGALDDERRYRGSPLRGADEPRSPDGSLRYTPLALSDLLGSRMGGYLDLGFQYQETMVQVVGGTDRLPQALAARIKDKITYQAVAKEMHQSERGVSVVYADRSGKLHKVEAEYCVCAIPLPLLAALETDFSPEIKQRIASVPYSAAGKMGLQFKRRFWEEDDHIYGGASKTDMEISQIVYPSSGYLTQKGVLVGYYLQGQNGRPIGDRTPAERQALALEQGARIHPQYQAEFETAFSVAWHRVPWSKGAWSNMGAALRKELSQPLGRVYLAGDHLNMNAWMQGAFESARQVATAVHARAGAERSSAVAVGL
ncbi:MAG: flavin monoamine oxidase family protein [Acidobacteria bacterium]|nr:flavin monoamine oxidase family protein [Acidobacteriota bacterium]